MVQPLGGNSGLAFAGHMNFRIWAFSAPSRKLKHVLALLSRPAAHTHRRSCLPGQNINIGMPSLTSNKARDVSAALLGTRRLLTEDKYEGASCTNTRRLEPATVLVVYRHVIVRCLAVASVS